MRLGLSARILAGTAASVVGSLLLALGIAQYATHRAANADLSRSLDQTAARVRDALRAQEQVMITGARSWADVASGVRSTSLAATDSLEPGNGYDHAVGAAAAIGADWAQIVNTAGVRQGKSDEPLWSRDGHTLFYRSGSVVYAATVTTSPAFSVVRRDPFVTGVFETNPSHTNYDVTPDGSHLLMVKRAGEDAQLVVVYNWVQTLRARGGQTGSR